MKNNFWTKIPTNGHCACAKGMSAMHCMHKCLSKTLCQNCLHGEIVFSNSTLQMFAGNCRDFAGKSECRDFKITGIAGILDTRNPHNFSFQISMQILQWKNMYTLHVISLKFTGNPCKFCMDISKNQVITWFPYN